MRSIVSVILGLGLIASTAGADTYKVDPSHSEIGFSVRHMLVSNVRGAFDGIDGSFFYNPEDLGSFTASATIPAASIDTRNADRDDHLRNADFFDVEQFPEISFKTTRVDISGEDPVLYGDLTMKGVTKEIRLPITLSGPVTDMAGKQRAGFEGSTKINRQDWGISWSKTLDGGGLVVSDEVKISVNIEGVNAGKNADEAIAAEQAEEAAQE